MYATRAHSRAALLLEVPDRRVELLGLHEVPARKDVAVEGIEIPPAQLRGAQFVEPLGLRVYRATLVAQLREPSLQKLPEMRMENMPALGLRAQAFHRQALEFPGGRVEAVVDGRQRSAVELVDELGVDAIVLLVIGLDESSYARKSGRAEESLELLEARTAFEEEDVIEPALLFRLNEAFETYRRPRSP